MLRSRISGAPALAVAALSVAVSSVAIAEPVPSIVLPDGNVLDVQSVVGSGPNSSFEVIDFQDVGGPAFAWEYQYTTPVSGYQMLLAIAAADPILSINATYYPEYDEYFVNNFTYGSYTGNASDYWNYWTGAWDSIDQSPDWAYSDYGPGDVTISNGSFDGWVADNNSPNLPETALPESGALTLLGSICLLACGKRRGVGRLSR